MTATAKTDKKEVVTIATHRAPVELRERIFEFIDNASPDLLTKIADASKELNGEIRTPKEGNRNLMGFYDYAVWLVLNQGEKEKTVRFGFRIVKDVQELMKQNLEAYANYPVEEHEWRLIGIGPTLLRAKGHNPKTIKDWLAINQKMLDDHHAEIGITDIMEHNRKRGKALKKMDML